MGMINRMNKADLNAGKRVQTSSKTGSAHEPLRRQQRGKGYP